MNLLRVFLSAYTSIFMCYYRVVPSVCDVLNSWIGIVNNAFLKYGITVVLPPLTCPYSATSSEEEVGELISQNCSFVMNIIYIEIAVSVGCLFYGLFVTNLSLSLMRYMLMVAYPLQQTVYTITCLEQKNLWLSYWLFYIVYNHVFYFDLDIYAFDVVEVLVLYVLVRYDFGKKILFSVVTYVNENKDKSIDDVVLGVYDLVKCKLTHYLYKLKNL